MSNQLMNKAATLAEILKRNRLTKSAADQEIEYKTVLSQSGIGAEQTQEIRDGMYNVNADTQAARNDSSGRVQEEPAGINSLNQDPEAALNASGTSVENVTVNGDPSAAPGDLQQSKAAAWYRGRLASILSMSKQASRIMTGTEVMSKLASLTAESPAEAWADAHDSIVKLASTNPLFGICKDRIMMEKMASDIVELAEGEGISPEAAAAELDAAQEANPEMADELEGEAEDEAVADVADIEEAAAELAPGIEQMAQNASDVFGMDVTPDDIIAAADEVTQQAEELGVEPEVLIQAAVEQMNEAEGAAGEEVSEEDLDNAQQILDAAAEQGISPEEVIQMAAGELEGGEPAPEEKQASYQSKRAAYCSYVRNNY